MYSRCLLLSLPAAPLTFAPHNKRAPLNALYGVKVGVLESCHLIGSEDFDIPQSQLCFAFICIFYVVDSIIVILYNTTRWGNNLDIQCRSDVNCNYLVSSRTSK